jgi:hypothetical protein
MNTVNIDPSMTPRAAAEILPTSSSTSSRPHSPISFNNPPASNLNGNLVNGQSANEETDPFDYQATVNELTIQFLSEFEETRVAALKVADYVTPESSQKGWVDSPRKSESADLKYRFWPWMMEHSQLF